MADTDLRQEIIDVLDELGAAVDTDIEQVTEIDEHVSIPGVRVDSSGNFVSYCLAKLNIFQNYFAQIWNAWFGTSTSTGVQGEWASLKSDAQADHTQAGQDHTQAQSDHTRAETDHSTASGDHTTAQGDHQTAGQDHTQATNDSSRAGTDHTTATGDHTQAGTDHSTASQDHSIAQGDHTQAGQDHTRAESDHSTAEQDHTQAGTDHTRAETDHANVAGAENLNATLVGFTVSITNRQGVTTSVDIGFEIYRTYTSVSAMNADAANVPQGKFVVIATTDTTDPDNAKMYCKNSQGSFTFLCDLDQASSSAWADWLNNMKPLIEQATDDAIDAAALANTKAQLADTKATLADTKAQYAESEGDRAKGYNDHPWEIGNDGYIYVWDETTEQMVQTNKMIIDFDDLTQQQIQEMIDVFFATLVYDDTPTQGSDNVVKSGGIWSALQDKQDKSNVASIATCESIIDELI